MSTVTIYALLCPFTDEPRYVGKTKRKMLTRYREHICNYSIDTHTFCGKWINELKKFKLLPNIKELEVCAEIVWQERERHWIKTYRPLYHLLNMDNGGIPAKYSPYGYADYYKGNKQTYEDAVNDIIHEVRRNINKREVTELKIIPNENQQIALDLLLNWSNNKHQEITVPTDDRVKVDFNNKLFFTLSGFAGTGKTTLLKLFLRDCRCRRITITAPTHKAKKVAERITGLQGQTIQKLLGLKLNTDVDTFDIDNLEFDQLGRSEMQYCDLVVVDECGMVNADLCEFIKKEATKYNTKILFIGDELQLPPVKEEISNTFLNSNYVKLTQIMRQSNTNPMNELLERLRNDIQNPHQNTFAEYLRDNPKAINEAGEGYQMIRTQDELLQLADVYFTSESFNETKDSVKFCAWTNEKVSEINKIIRKIVFKERANEQVAIDDVMMGYRTISDTEGNVILYNSEDYIVTDVTIQDNYFDLKCLRINMKSLDTGIKTPPVFIVKRDDYEAFIEVASKKYKDAKQHRAWKAYFEFADNSLTIEPIKIQGNTVPKSIDYGYGLTVHKTQGSTYETIFVHASDIARNFNVVEKRKLLYVALSRASKNCIIYVTQ